MATLAKRLFAEYEEIPSTVKKTENNSSLEDKNGDTENGDTEDGDYFRSYSDIHIHQEMLADQVRTNTYRWAVLKNYELFYGKVVLDVGAGTGILSMFAVQAGAKKVYAVEASDLYTHLHMIVKENNMEERISVIHGKVEDIALPEKVDVIISEWMGYCLLYESMLKSVIHARDNWLKPSGFMMPSTAKLFLAPISDEDYKQRLEFWSQDVEELYKVSMETMIPLARKNLSQTATVKIVSEESPQSHAQVVCELDLKTVKENELKDIFKEFSFSCFGLAEIHGFVLWFDVEFPQKIKLTTSPYSEDTHWQQCVLYVENPKRVKQDCEISGSIRISPNVNKPRFLDINLSYAFNNKEMCHKYYYMSDIIT